MNRRSLLAAAAALSLSFAVPPAIGGELKPYEADNFPKVVAAGPVIVHVHADWCPVCKVQRPTLASLANDPKLAKVSFVVVNFDKDKDFLKANKVANQSVIVVFKGGKEVARLSGVTDAAKIREDINKVL